MNAAREIENEQISLLKTVNELHQKNVSRPTARNAETIRSINNNKNDIICFVYLKKNSEINQIKCMEI